MKKYRKKPIVIEAVQWPGFINIELSDKLGITRCPTTDHNLHNGCPQCPNELFCHGEINILEDVHIICPGDWIIKGIKGELYLCKPDIFEATYEEVKDK